jgi:hypothetical protein
LASWPTVWKYFASNTVCGSCDGQGKHPSWHATWMILIELDSSNCDPSFHGTCQEPFQNPGILIWTICLYILIGGLEHLAYFSHHIGNVIIPTDFHSIIFQRGRSTTTSHSLMSNDQTKSKS